MRPCPDLGPARRRSSSCSPSPGAPAPARGPGAPRRWAPGGDGARSHPGVQMFTAGAQCTGNFVYTDDAGRRLRRVRRALRRQGRGRPTPTAARPRRSRSARAVGFAEGATVATPRHDRRARHARLQLVAGDAPGRHDRAPTPAPTTTSRWCGSTPHDVGKVNPSVPFWGGPSGVATGGAPPATQVYTWGQSSLRAARPRSRRRPASRSAAPAAAGRWDVYTATPGIPGDSGSGFLDADGRALGVLSTVAIAPLAGSNGVGRPRPRARVRPRPLGHRRAAPGARHRAVHALRLTGRRRFRDRFGPRDRSGVIDRDPPAGRFLPMGASRASAAGRGRGRGRGARW